MATRRALAPYRTALKAKAGRGNRLLGDWIVRPCNAAKPPIGPQRMRTDGESPVTNFPATGTRLFGRRTEVARLRELLSANRVVTLTGPGGIGKTRLALKAARGVVGEYANGAWLVELASLSEPTLVPATVAGVLGPKLGSATISADALARAVGNNHLLLLFDNCERVVDAVALLAEVFIRRCPRVTIMATSRETLRVEGEWVYRVAPLDVPAVGEDEPGEILSRSAVQLFIARATALNPGFSPGIEDTRQIAAMCRQLDGIPLAIEFAAARAAVLGVRQVTADLGDRIDLLQAGDGIAPPRHRTLRAALDWSYQLLPHSEQRLLRCLAMFSGGFTLAAAAAVMRDCGPDTAAVTDGVANLVAKSLIAIDLAETETRWHLLETTRAYALEKLAECGEFGSTARRHAEYCLAMFAPFAAEGQLQAALDELKLYRREIDNLRAALNWAFGADGDAAVGGALAAAAADFWVAVSLVAEACKWSTTALARIGDAAGTREEMILQCSLGASLIFTRGMVGEAWDALTRGLSLARTLGDFDYQQRMLHKLWLFSLRMAAVDDALAIAQDYDEVARRHDPQSRAVANGLIGAPQLYRGEHLEASTRLRQAIDDYPIAWRGRDAIRFGNDLRASASAQLSVSLLSCGQLDTASRAAVDAVEEARGGGQPIMLCAALAFAAGVVFLSLGEFDTTECHGEELIVLGEQYALRPFHAAGLCIRGSLATRRTDPAVAVDLLRRGLADLQAASYLLLYPYFRIELAAALGAAGRAADGIAEIDALLHLAENTGHRWLVPETLRVKGELLAQHGPDDPTAVAELFRGAVRQAHAQNALYWELSAAISLAELLHRQHREAEARAVLAPIYHRFTEGFSAAKVQRARLLLEQLR